MGSPPMSPAKKNSAGGGSGPSSSEQSAMASPVFKSAAAKAIIEEVGKTPRPTIYANKRAERKDKKRSFTITGSQPAVTEALNAHQAKEDGARSRDDLDLEQTIKSPSNNSPPDVIRSALNKDGDQDGDEDSAGGQVISPSSNLRMIDNLFGIPDKIVIPERYVPDTDMDNQTPEERQVRLKKADSIRRMLAEQSGPAGNAMNSLGDSGSSLGDQSTMSAEVRQQMDEEKRQREHLLGLNQLIAQQVKERSRMVAVTALANKKFPEDDDCTSYGRLTSGIF